MSKHSNSLPNSPQTDTNFSTFQKITQSYLDELNSLYQKSSDDSNLSQNDMIVIDDLLKEIKEYINILLEQKLLNESKKLLESGLNIIDLLIKLLGEKKNENISYPLSMRMSFLESYFHILFQQEKNYSEAEKILKEILELGEFINVPMFNKASTKFYMAIIKLYKNQIDQSEKMANEALEMLEKSNEEENEEETNNSKKLTKISNILEFLAEIYQLKKAPQKVIKCYEKAYYLNLGRSVGQNVYTDYFKTKLEIYKQEIGEYQPSPLGNNEGIKASSSYSIYNRSNPQPNENQKKETMTLYKGTADSFSFKIPTTVLYEPFIISVYQIGNGEYERFDNKLFFCNLCFDKTTLLNFLGEGFSDNGFFYTDDNMNKILTNISLVNGYISLLDPNLKDALIKTNNKSKIKK